MNSTNFFIAEAVISVLFGILLFLIPEQFLHAYMIEGDSIGAVGRGVARAYGGILLGVGIIAWQFRSTQGAIRKTMLLGCLVAAATAGTAYLIELISGQVNSMSWISVGMCTFLVVWALILLLKGKEQTP